jgi:hypothetical protein
MSGTPRVDASVDTFSDGNGFFVRTEIEARAVAIDGPFPDLQTAQRLQADQLAYVKQASQALKEQLQKATASSPAASTAR